MSNCLTLALVLLSNKKGFATVKRYRSYIDIKVVLSSFNIGNVWCERPYSLLAPHVCG